MRNLFSRYFGRPHRRRKSNACRPRLEVLETRTLLAAVFDSGNNLWVQLEDGERLEISTDGQGTQFHSSNSVFSADDLEHTSAFSGFGTDSLSLNNVSLYEKVSALGWGVASTVAVVDSGENVYGHHLHITSLSAASSETEDVVFFSGQSHFGDHNLVIESQRGIVFQPGSEVTVVDGSVKVFSELLGGTNAQGITVDGATITTAGSGQIQLVDRSAYELEADVDGPVIHVTNGSRIESTSLAGNAGAIEILGSAPERTGLSFGVTVEDSVIRSHRGRIKIEDGGGDGTQDVDRGITLKNATIESSGEGEISIIGSGWGTDLAAGIQIEGSTVLSTGDGPIRIHGVANGSDRSSHGILVSDDALVETTSAPILLHGDNHQDEGEAHHGVELASGSTIRSDSGEIYVKGNRTGTATANSYAVKVSTQSGASTVSIVSQTGNMTFELLGNPDAETLFLGQGTTIGGADAAGDIKFFASDFEWQNSGVIQSSGQLLFQPSSFDDLYLGVEAVGKGLSAQELGFLGDGFRQISLRVGGDIIVEEAIFLAPVVFSGRSTIMAGGTALTAPLSKIYDLSLPEFEPTTIDGNVEFAGSLVIDGVTHGSQLNVTGRLDIGQSSNLVIDWDPSPDEKNGAQKTLISRNGGSGAFQNTVSKNGRDVLLPELLSAYLEYGESGEGDITLTIPASNSSNTPLISQPIGVESGIDTTFEWQALPNVQQYHYQLIRLTAGPTVWIEGHTEALSWTSSGTLPVGRYRMWVRAELEGGTFSRWASQSFQVSRAVPGLQVLESTNSQQPSISFDDVSGAHQYQIYVTNFTTRESGYFNTMVAETSWAVPESLSMGSYGFWVRAVSVDGYVSRWSVVQTYDVAPTLQPLDAVPDRSPTFKWSPINGAATYEIYMSGRQNVVHEKGISATEFQMTDLSAADYRAWVRGVTGDGRPGPWSSVMNFSTDGLTQLSIASHTIGTALPLIEWWSVATADEYEIYVSEAGSGEAYERQSGITANSYQPGPLPAGDFKVWVRTRTDGAVGRWSTGHSFSVNDVTSSVGQPSGLSPQGPILNQKPTFSWSPVEGAAGYTVYLSVDGSTEVFNRITQTEFTPPKPITKEDVEWWVRAYDDQSRFGPLSDSQQFNPLGRPILQVTPTAQAVFEWTGVVGAERYVLRADSKTTGESFVVDETQLTGTSFAPSETLPAGSYRAWVRAVSAGNTIWSPWSIRVDFTIDN